MVETVTEAMVTIERCQPDAYTTMRRQRRRRRYDEEDEEGGEGDKKRRENALAIIFQAKNTQHCLHQRPQTTKNVVITRRNISVTNITRMIHLCREKSRLCVLLMA